VPSLALGHRARRVDFGHGRGAEPGGDRSDAPVGGPRTPNGPASRGAPRAGVGLVEPLEADEAPEPAVGHEQVPVRMPVGPRAMRLQAGHKADREVALTRQRADGGDGAGGGAGDRAE
jgi:hypothetical protein